MGVKMQEILLFAGNHWVLFLVLGIASVCLILVESLKLKHATSQLTPVKMTQLINHENAAVVDIRPSDAFASGHIIDAISIPSTELNAKINNLDKFKSRPIVLVCMSGTESQQAVNLLKNNGLNAYSLAGGIKAWREAEMPLVKG